MEAILGMGAPRGLFLLAMGGTCSDRADCVKKSSGSPCTPAQKNESCNIEATLNGTKCKTLGQTTWVAGSPAKPDTCGTRLIQGLPGANDKCVSATSVPCSRNLSFNCESQNYSIPPVGGGPAASTTQCVAIANGDSRDDSVRVDRKDGASCP